MDTSIEPEIVKDKKPDQSLEGLALTRLESRIPGLKRHSVLNTLLSIKYLEEDIEWWSEVFKGMIIENNFIPDASRFVTETETLQLFEVEDSSKITFEKLNRIIHFSDVLYEYTAYWTELYSADRYGIHATLIWSSRADAHAPSSKEKFERVKELAKLDPIHFGLTPKALHRHEYGCYDGPAIGSTL
jgi:hypothetical protein